MTKLTYCSIEWLEESSKLYKENPKFRQELAKVSTRVGFRIKAEPDWGIDTDIVFGAFVEKGDLLRLSFFSEEEAKKELEFIMSATPQEWKKILRKENKFLTDFMIGKIVLDQGSKVGVLSIAPYANHFIDALTQVELHFQDEMSEGELADYRSTTKEFREALGV
jgi:hypothetical protein